MDELDDAYARFASTAPEWGAGFSNHGPMACEALVQLGHSALVPGCVDIYAPRLPELPPGKELSAPERARARGDMGRVADWIASYRAEVERGDWQPVLRSSVLELSPGLFGAAGHGFLRTAHAARALAAADNPVRRTELAHGLGYWAAAYTPLPEARENGQSTFDDALSALDRAESPPLLGEGEMLSDVTPRLSDHPGLRNAISGADTLSGPLSDRISALCGAVARRYLGSEPWRIAHTHAITVPSAVRLLLPVVGEAAAEEAFRYAWQTSAVLCAVGVSSRPIDANAEKTALARNRPELRYRAACSLEEHAIKLTEACLREAAELERDATPSNGPDVDALLTVAADAALCMGEPGRRNC